MIDSFRGSYAFLSNFYSSPLTYEGISYPTVEHAFQAAKSLDPVDRRMIAKASTPGAAKKLGRRVSLRRDWESAKIGVMAELLVLKFHTHPHLLEQLLDTGDEELIEGNTWGDRFWGKVNGVGQNWLGKLLMAVRESA